MIMPLCLSAYLLCSVYLWVEVESFLDFRVVVLSAFAFFRKPFPLADSALLYDRSLFGFT